MVNTRTRTHPHPVAVGWRPALLWLAAVLASETGGLAILGVLFLAGDAVELTGARSTTATENMLFIGGLTLAVGSPIAARLLRRAVRLHTPGELSPAGSSSRSTDTPDIVRCAISLAITITVLLVITRSWGPSNFLTPVVLYMVGISLLGVGLVNVFQPWRRHRRFHRGDIIFPALVTLAPGVAFLVAGSSAPVWGSLTDEQASSLRWICGFCGILGMVIYAVAKEAKQHFAATEFGEELVEDLAEVLSKDELAPTLKKAEGNRATARGLIAGALAVVGCLLICGFLLDNPLVAALAGVAIGLGVMGSFWIRSWRGGAGGSPRRI